MWARGRYDPWVSLKRGEIGTQTHTQGEGWAKEAEVRVTRPQAKACQTRPATPRIWEKARTALPHVLSRNQLGRLDGDSGLENSERIQLFQATRSTT